MKEVDEGNVKKLMTEKEKRQMELEKMKNDMDYLTDILTQSAKMRFVQYQAFVDAGFTEEQSMDLMKAGIK
jgi:hypothetical protein